MKHFSVSDVLFIITVIVLFGTATIQSFQNSIKLGIISVAIDIVLLIGLGYFIIEYIKHKRYEKD